MRRRSLLLLAPACLLAAPARAAEDPLPPGTVRCRIWAQTTGREPAGLALHRRPARTAPVVARLPRAGGTIRDETLFEVIGHRYGWLLVENAFNPGEGPGAGFVTDKRRGWVRADLVGLRVASPVLRAAPRPEAPVAARLPRADPPSIDGAWGERTVLACAGEWVKLRTEHGTGWAERTCTAADDVCP